MSERDEEPQRAHVDFRKQEILRAECGAAELLRLSLDEEPCCASYLYRSRLSNSTRKKGREWQLDVGPVSGAAGVTTTISIRPRCTFETEQIMATDTHSGCGTKIGQILVGQTSQLREIYTPTKLLARESFFGDKFDACRAALDINVAVSFVFACTFYMALFGRAIV